MKIEVYRKFYDSFEANIIANKLKANGVDCFLTNEHITSILWHMSIAHGGVSLMMNSDDFSKADHILLSDSSLTIEDDQHQGIKCPKCTSNNISYGANTAKVNWWQLIVAVLIGMPAPMPIPMKSYHCHKCGNDFKYSHKSKH